MTPDPRQLNLDLLIKFLNKYTHSGTKIITVHKEKSIELWTEECPVPFVIKTKP